MNKNELRKIVEKRKYGTLTESTNTDDVFFSEDSYDMNKPCFLVTSRHTILENDCMVINENFIKECDDDVINATLDSEIDYCNTLYSVLKNEGELKHSDDANDYANIIAYLSTGLSSEKIFEVMKHYISDGGYQYFNENRKEKINEVKSLVVEKLSKYDNFIDVSRNTILDEGMIKVPETALSMGKDIIDMCIYQLSIDSVYDESAMQPMQRFIDSLGMDEEVKSLRSKLIGPYISYDTNDGFSGHVDMKISKNDIPYYIDQSYIPLSIVLSMNDDYSGMSDEIDGVPFIKINVSELYNAFMKSDVLNNPLLFLEKSFIEKIKKIRSDLMSTITHELMHVMQHTVFAHNEYKKGSNNPKSIDKSGLEVDPYITSQVEFDPLINDAVNTFKNYIESAESYVGNSFDNDVKKELLKKFLGTEYPDGKLPSYFDNIDTIIYNALEQVFRPTHFIKTIKDDYSTKYPLMVKKIYNELAL